MTAAERVIETDRLLLRPFEPADTEAYAAIRARPEIARFLLGGEAAASRAHEVAERVVTSFAGSWDGSPGYGPWAAIEKASGRLVGHVGLRLLPELGQETEILYMIDSPAWGRGYATEGAVAARDFGFGRLGLPRLIALALPDNAASIRVMQKIGMRREAGLVEAFGLQLVRCVLDRGAIAADPTAL